MNSASPNKIVENSNENSKLIAQFQKTASSLQTCISLGYIASLRMQEDVSEIDKVLGAGQRAAQEVDKEVAEAVEEVQSTDVEELQNST